MQISNHIELISFLKKYFHQLSHHDYINIIQSSIGVYEWSKPDDLEQLVKKIESHSKFNRGVETPLFW